MEWFQFLVTILCTVIASSGFWALIQKKIDKNDTSKKVLIGIAHDRIVELGMHYLNRGDWITNDEYENLHDYLWLPYKEYGGNGSAEKIMQEIEKLHIVSERKEGSKHEV